MVCQPNLPWLVQWCLVRELASSLRVYSQGQLIATVQKQPRSQQIIVHPDQFADVSPAPSLRHTTQPVGHQIEAPPVTIRDLSEYDQLFGVEVVQ